MTGLKDQIAEWRSLCEFDRLNFDAGTTHYASCICLLPSARAALDAHDKEKT